MRCLLEESSTGLVPNALSETPIYPRRLVDLWRGHGSKAGGENVTHDIDCECQKGWFFFEDGSAKECSNWEDCLNCDGLGYHMDYDIETGIAEEATCVACNGDGER